MNSKTTRRNFIKESAAGLAGASLLAPFLMNCGGASGGGSKSVGLNTIGFQSWAIKEMLAKDFAGTLKMMVDMGYQSMELCSPPGYTQYGFGFLDNIKAPELKKMINDTGISCVSCHYGFNELKENGQARMDFAKELGLT